MGYIELSCVADVERGGEGRGGEGRGGRETKGEGRTKGDVPFLTPFALFFLISHLTFP